MSEDSTPITMRTVFDSVFVPINEAAALPLLGGPEGAVDCDAVVSVILANGVWTISLGKGVGAGCTEAAVSLIKSQPLT